MLPAVLASGVLVAWSSQENKCANHTASTEEKQELGEDLSLANMTL